MYIQMLEGLGQEQKKSFRHGPCVGDDTLDKIECAMLNNSEDITLSEFNFRESGLRTWHKTWIRNKLVPAIIKSWKGRNPVQTILIIGHTDETGDAKSNYGLALARAKMVATYIASQLEQKSPGLSKKISINTFSSGECYPAFMKSQRDRRNRRVVISLIKAICKEKPSNINNPPKCWKDKLGYGVCKKPCPPSFTSEGFLYERAPGVDDPAKAHECRYVNLLTAD